MIDLPKGFADLAHQDPRVREAARAHLMSLTRRDLPALRKLVEANRPLAPAQAVALREIVAQMYLSTDEYETSAQYGFLGIRPGEAAVNLRPPAAAAANANNENAPNGLILPPVNLPPGVDWPAGQGGSYGIVVLERMAGFCGCRMFQDGDVILSIQEYPDAHLHDPRMFSGAVRQAGAGQTIHFLLLRRGQIFRVPVKLDPRPRAADDDFGGTQMQQLLDRRKTEVDELWGREFAPLLKEGVG